MLSRLGTSRASNSTCIKLAASVGKTVATAALGQQPMEASMDTRGWNGGDPLETGGSSVSSKVQRSSKHSKCLIVASLNHRPWEPF